MNQEKDLIYKFWNNASCGELLYLNGNDMNAYILQSNKRYTLEPQILNFVSFNSYKEKEVLEIGIGLGSDHQKFAEAGAKLTGIDLTERSVEHTKKRFKLFGLHSNIQVADAENLPFSRNTFDLVYSWGVLHHSPNTKKSDIRSIPSIKKRWRS